ncbi:MAG: HDOD domain-containing protein [Gemmatimonadales bacterium]|nr:MAG: HDOD domain-containing protein [Gemmatimonadales bacterium]
MSPDSRGTSMNGAREMVDGLRALGSPPEVHGKIVRELGRPDSGSRDIARVIAEDPGLVARLLGLVNSALYGLPRRVESLERAVTMVGTRQLRELVLATSIISSFDGIVDDQLDMRSFWKHSLACGVGARRLALIQGADHPETHFLAGLVHDLGRLVLLLEGGERMAEAMEMAREGDLLLHEAERLLFGFDHTQVGQCLMERWKLGADLEEAVAFHHAPFLATRHPEIAASVHLADLFANALRWGSSGAFSVAPLTPCAWTRLGIPDGEVDGLLDSIQEEWGEVVEVVLMDRPLEEPARPAGG